MNEEKPEVFTAKRIAWITGVACVACWTVPVLGIAIGSASIAGLALYAEKAAAAVAVIGVGFLVFKRLSQRTAQACGCSPNKADAEV